MNGRPPQDHAIPIAVLALFLLNSPFTGWWMHLALPWYAMFLPWLLLIVLVWLNQRTTAAPTRADPPDDKERR